MSEPCRACHTALPPGAAICPNCGTAQTHVVPSVTSGNRPSAQRPTTTPPVPPRRGPSSRPPIHLETTTVLPRSSPAASATPPPPTSPAPRQRLGPVIAMSIIGFVVVLAAVGVIVALSTHHGSSSGTADIVTDTAPGESATTAPPLEGQTADRTDRSVDEVAPTPGQSVIADGSTDPDGTVDVAQRYNNALSRGDWSAARSLHDGLDDSTDADLQDGFGGLDDASVIATSVSDDTIRGGLVAWETVSSGRRTSIYCKDWTVDPSRGVVTREHDLDPVTGGKWQRTGWVRPTGIVEVVRSQCG